MTRCYRCEKDLPMFASFTEIGPIRIQLCPSCKRRYARHIKNYNQEYLIDIMAERRQDEKGKKE